MTKEQFDRLWTISANRYYYFTVVLGMGINYLGYSKIAGGFLVASGIAVGLAWVSGIKSLRKGKDFLKE